MQDDVQVKVVRIDLPAYTYLAYAVQADDNSPSPSPTSHTLYAVMSTSHSPIDSASVASTYASSNVVALSSSVSPVTPGSPTMISHSINSSDSSYLPPSSSSSPLAQSTAASPAPDQASPSVSSDDHRSSANWVKPVIGAGLAVFVIALVTLLVCCVKRRRQRAGPGGRTRLNDDEMIQTRSRGPVTLGTQPTQKRTQRDPRVPTRSLQIDLTRDELFDVVPIPPPAVRVRDSGPNPTVPSLSTIGLHTSNGRNRSRRGLLGGNSNGDRQAAESSRGDGEDSNESELDAFATDGSSATRTLSTRSVVSSGMSETPFHHPAYTLAPSSRRTAAGTGTETGTSIDVGSWLSWGWLASSRRASSPSPPPSPRQGPTYIESSPTTDSDPFNPPPSPSQPSQVRTRTSANSVYSANSAAQTWLNDDDVQNSLLSAHFPAHSARTPSRGVKIVQHVDAGRARVEAMLPDMNGDKHRQSGEVHIPPTYRETYLGERDRLFG